MYSQSSGFVKFIALIDSSSLNTPWVQVYYNGIPTGFFLKDDGFHEDFAANDKVFGNHFLFPPGTNKGKYLFEILAEEQFSLVSDPYPYFSVE